MDAKGVTDAWIGLCKKSNFLFNKAGKCKVYDIFKKVLPELKWTEGNSEVLTLPVQPSQLLIDECEGREGFSYCCIIQTCQNSRYGV